MLQVDVVNGLQLLTAKSVTYLVNLSEKDYVRKKNKWYVSFITVSLSLCVQIDASRLPKIKGWIDVNNPGDPLIPFSVALEERLAAMSPEEKADEEKRLGVSSCLGKIVHAGYACLDVRCLGAFGLV